MNTLILFLALVPPAAANVPAIPSTREWEETGFGNPRVVELATEPLPPEQRKGSLPLYFLLLRGSEWTEEQVRNHLSQISTVYAQCGLEIGPTTLIEVDPPGGHLSFARYPKDGVSLISLVEDSPLKNRPVIYLFSGYTEPGRGNDRAFSAADWKDAYEKSDFHPVLFNSVFLPVGINSAAFLEEHKDKPYSTAAHELLHVLLRLGGHPDNPIWNLRNVNMHRSNHILPEECETALQSPLVSR